MLRDYPGTRQTLDAVVDWLLVEGQLLAPRIDDAPARVFISSLLVLARRHYRHQSALAQTATDAQRVLRRRFPGSFVHRLFGLMTEIPTLASTAEALALARRMVELMQQEAQEAQAPQPSAPSPQGQPQSNDRQPTGSDGAQEGEDDGAGQESSGEGLAASQPATDPSAQDGQAQGEAQGQGRDQDLVDLSGSMCGGEDRLALDAAMALALALEPIKGVCRAVTAFPDRSGGEGQVTQVLAHGERVARRAGAFIQRGRGSTPLTGALWFAAADLLARPEPRKVLLTLTDGAPDDRPSAARLIAQVQAAGITLIGLGIARDVNGLFPTAVRIDDISELKVALFRLAEQLLLTPHH